MLYLDTNIFVRFLARDDEEKFQQCKRLFLQIERGELVAAVTESVIAEVVFVLSSKRIGYGCSRGDIAGYLESILSLEGLLFPEKERILAACALYAESDLDFEDCILVTCLGAEDQICSYDRGLDRALEQNDRIEP